MQQTIILEKAIHRKGRQGTRRKTKHEPSEQDRQSGDCIRVHLSIDFLGVLSVLGGSIAGFGLTWQSEF
jgi:hypothetical protein